MARRETEAMRIRYEGPAPFASLVAQKLDEEGVQVTYTPPLETRGAADVLQAVVLYMGVKIIDGLTNHAVDAAIDRVKTALGQRFKSIKINRED